MAEETNVTQLKEQIQVVVRARHRAQEAIGVRDAARLEWEEQNRAVLDEVSTSTQERESAETRLRELTLEAYSQTGNKAPAVGVGIRIMTRLNYQAEKAMEWAMEHKLALRLDQSTFEKIAKTSNLSFVSITDEPQATIATELDKQES